MNEAERVGDTYTHTRPANYGHAALGAIADELRKLRLLKEYELKVLVGEDDDETLQVVSGDGDTHYPVQKGEPLYNEDTGTVAL